MATTANLGLPLLDPAQAQKETTHNAALAILDVIALSSVLQAFLVVPPATPTNGQAWIVGPAATGVWLAKDNQVAAWINGWQFFPPQNGWQLFDLATKRLLFFSAGVWSVGGVVLGGYVGLTSDDGAPRIRCGKLGTDNRVLVDLYDTTGGSAVEVRDSSATTKVQLKSDGTIATLGTKVIGARDTGWAAMTGTSTKTAIDTGTATLAQLAQRVKAMSDAMIAHGLIGA